MTWSAALNTSIRPSQGEKNDDMEYYLDSLDLPRMPEETQTRLEDKISKQEVLDTLTRLPEGKAPGPNGFTIDFFKAFANKLLDPFVANYGY